MMPSTADLVRVLPELVLTAFGLMVMVAEPFLPRDRKRLLGPVALVGTLAALVAAVAQARNPGYAFSQLVVIDGFSSFLHFVLLAITALTIIASFRYL